MVCASNQFPATTKQIHIPDSAVKNPLGLYEGIDETHDCCTRVNELGYYPLLGWKQTTSK